VKDRMDKKRISKKKMQENRMRQYISIINSPEYREQLTEMAKRIVKLSETAPNEATIESNFDCELFAFFRDKFHTLGFEYNPTKEKAVATTRNMILLLPR
jgi:GTP cyclohydrolase I